MAHHFDILAWRTPGTEEPGRDGPEDHNESDTTEVFNSSSSSRKMVQMNLPAKQKWRHKCTELIY